MLITRMFDAVTYPLIGYLSDRSYVRSGTRRNWTIAGTLLSMLGTWFLLRPPQNVSVLYFGIWTAVLYVGWKTIEIPLQARSEERRVGKAWVSPCTSGWLPYLETDITKRLGPVIINDKY